ncbi:hypothetical protein GCK72_025696 [Caenorhabditis remanei]|uniref:Uncharacterized protein n=3 Tax=Caenorhabditis TaxID=6237 RepID=E3MBZ2_CAERE|nr:hypothetical protein GCK72_025696 [Caenorhabditis remanei]EFO98111.1 hypothetical protein CRE_15272 [Caenorhabditis remanei]KAF1749229.1 hypothetical protein GCK72_025696 [Caenorhabditis remanei]
MSAGFCKATRMMLVFQAFIFKATKEFDLFVSVLITAYFCALHVYTRSSPTHSAVSLQVTRTLGIVSLFFLTLRIIDLHYC